MKTIRIKVNGQTRTLNAKKLMTTQKPRTGLPHFQYWIPRDEANDNLSSSFFTAQHNGIYRIAQPGEATGLVSQDERGFVEYVVQGQCIRNFETDVDIETEWITITENGEYQAAAPAKGYRLVIVDVQPKAVSLTVTADGTYTPQRFDGYDVVYVNIPHPKHPAEYISKTITENGIYRITDEPQTHYGYDTIDIQTKKNQLKPTEWQKVYETEFGADITSEFFRNSQSVVYNGNIYVIKGNKLVRFVIQQQGPFYPPIVQYYFITAPMAFQDPVMTVYDGKIWIFNLGGSVYSYDGTEWTQESSVGRMVYHAIVYNNALHIASGDNKIYTYFSGEWVETISIRQAQDSELILYNGRLYNFGGQLGTSVYSYDPDTGEEQQHGNMEIAVYHPRTVIHNGVIRALGCDSSRTQSYSKASYSDQSYNGDFWRIQSFFGYDNNQLPSNYIIAEELDGVLYVIGNRPIENGTTWCVWRLLEDTI